MNPLKFDSKNIAKPEYKALVQEMYNAYGVVMSDPKRRIRYDPTEKGRKERMALMSKLTKDIVIKIGKTP